MGYVYLLTNPSMPGLVKLGCTERSPAERICELSAATGVPTPFVVEYSILVPDHVTVEQELHAALVNYRVNDSREFFRISVEDAKRFLRGRLLDLIAAEVVSWDEETLAKLVDHILSRRPTVRNVLGI